MIDELIQGFDSEVFGALLNEKFAGTFSPVTKTIPVDDDLPWKSAEQLGIVKTLVGENDANMPLLVVTAELPEGEELRERSSRVKQFKFARQVLDTVMANPFPGIEGLISQGLFVFHDEQGNFRLSLVYGKPEGTKLVWSAVRRLSFYVEVGAGNKTFRDRLALPWSSFEKLKEAFSVEKLTKEFYKRLFKWYQWALSDEMGVTYPNNTDTDEDDRQISEHIIRLITRLMFVWFLKQKHLVPDKLFDPAELEHILKKFDPVFGDNYYRAILQNLFFATLNSEIPERAFATEKGDRREHFDIKTLYRYPREFAISESEVLELFERIPFLNGGLFECLDRGKNYYDGFSRNRNRVAQVPNRLFFDPDEGLIPLLRQYNFTVEENSPGDEEIALDPELLGQVFENLLAAYNPETNVQARKATGSFYTPREIVNYMVDESLIAYLKTRCGEEHEESIRKLFDDGKCPEDGALCKQLDEALVTAKILDPACGSGAFPMGMLLRMVDLLRILRDIPEDESVYDLKLELIENCIYGADIQCIAVQISKLRFFISLVCEQQPNDDPLRNYGIKALPNLETKFVAANSLIGLPRDSEMLPMQDVEALKKQLWNIRHRHFLARTYQDKKDLRKEDRKLRTELAKALEQGGGFDTESAKLMAEWDLYDQNRRAEFLDTEWMFNVSTGFNIVIGNPPYVLLQADNRDNRFIDFCRQNYAVASYKIDLFHLFIEKGIQLLTIGGELSFIVPSNFASNNYSVSLREYILKRTRLWRLVFFEDDVFEASVNNLMLFAQRNAPLMHSTAFCKARIDSGLLELRDLATRPQSALAQEKFLLVPRMCNEADSVLRKISDTSSTFGTVARVNFGMQLRNRKKFTTDVLDSPEKSQLTSQHRRCYVGKDIHRYWVDYSNHYCYFNREAKRGGCWDEQVHNSKEKILVRQIGDYPEGGIDYRGFAVLNAAFMIVPHAVDSLYLLGILNSSSIRFYWLNKFRDDRRTFPKIKGEYLKLLPVPNATSKEHVALIDLVDLILVSKKGDPVADVSTLEAKIDQLVYELYGLTPEEIAIVEESLGRSGDSSGGRGKAEKNKGKKSSSAKTSTSANVTADKTAERKAVRRKKTNLPDSLPGWD